jgi:glycosyltransferase involved in cell wall biosynthesis
VRALKILWVKAGGLIPLDTGGKIRSYQILKDLSRRHAITFFTFYAEHANDCHEELNIIFDRVICCPLRIPQPKSLRGLARYARNFLSFQPYQIVKYCLPQVAASLAQLLQRERFDVIVCDFLVPAGIIPWDFPCPKVLFTHNVEARIWERHFHIANNPVWKAISWREYRAMVRAERHYLRLANRVLTVSNSDRDYFSEFIAPDKITVIPTGVDVDFFQPVAGKEQPNFLVFTGSMDWRPNEDGILHFVKTILPRIRIQVPNVSLLVVGRHPSPRLLALTKTIEGVQVTGKVEDIRAYVHQGSVYIVPLRVGSGTRLKIFEAMAMGKAVVSTSIGAEGLPVQPGRDIVLADTPESFASAVINLLHDPVRRGELGRAARELVEQKYSWESIGKDFESVLVKVARGDKNMHSQSLVSSFAGE